MVIFPPEASSPSHRRAAFTLVEMLTVVAIAVTLATLLTVGAGRALKTAKQSRSISNLRTVQQAITSYLGENDGRYPFNSAPNAGTPRWTQTIDSYLPEKQTTFLNLSGQPFKMRDVLSCPLLDADRHHDISDYGVNNAVILREANGTSQLAAAVITKPAQTVTLMTAQQSDSGGAIRGTWYVNATGYVSGNATTFIPSARGIGKILCAFADGHTEAIPEDTFFTDRKKYLLPTP